MEKRKCDLVVVDKGKVKYLKELDSDKIAKVALYRDVREKQPYTIFLPVVTYARIVVYTDGDDVILEYGKEKT